MLVGGSVDPEGNVPVGTCTLDGVKVKSLTVPRCNVALCVGHLRSQQNSNFEKQYVLCVGGNVGSQALAAVERYNVKSDVWMALPDLNINR